jgi:hypothetical protein
MPPEQFKQLFPLIRDWIGQTLAAHAEQAKPVASLNFPRLPHYYSHELLARAKVVFVDKCPVPPLGAFGLTQFDEFENMSIAGITYLDTYFALWYEAELEALHFHELVHVIQWQCLGPERFLALYANGLEQYGYRHSPLEVMAYNHEAQFKSGQPVYAVEAAVREQLKRL